MPIEMEQGVRGDKIPLDKFRSEDTVGLGKWMLGKTLLTQFDGHLTGGMIVETEAYLGEQDAACHAFQGKRTPRTATMFQEAGVAYVYQCYGIHHLLNIVTGPAGHPHVVLIRAMEPKIGIDIMLKRRKMQTLTFRLTAGPGVLCEALGIDRNANGITLSGPEIWVEEPPAPSVPIEITASPRVGVAYAGQDALLPLRFRIKGNPWSSPAK